MSDAAATSAKRLTNKIVAARFLLYWAPLIAWMIAIFLLSNTTQATVESTISGLPSVPAKSTITSPHVVHMLQFGLLAVLFYRLLVSHKLGPVLFVCLGAVSLTVTYGVTDEIHQAFVPGRDPSISDLLFDAIGALIGVGLAEAAVKLAKWARRRGPLSA